MKYFNFIIILFLTIGSVGCSGLKFMIGSKEIHEERNADGKLVRKKEVKKHTTSLIHHPHNPLIIKTKIWTFNNDNLVELTFEKRKRTMIDWDGEVLKFKKKTWTEDGIRIK